MATVTEFKCLHCSTQVSIGEIKDGWCDSCGKKIPYSIHSEAKKMGALAAQPKDDYDEPKPGSARRMLVAALVFVSLLAAAAVTVVRLG